MSTNQQQHNNNNDETNEIMNRQRASSVFVRRNKCRENFRSSKFEVAPTNEENVRLQM